MDELEELKTRMTRVENTLERHSERFVNIEGKLANDYKAIQSLQNDVKALMCSMENNSKLMKEAMKKMADLESMVETFIAQLEEIKRTTEEYKALAAETRKDLKKNRNALKILAVVSIASLLYSTIQNGTTVSAITSIATALKALGLIP